MRPFFLQRRVRDGSDAAANGVQPPPAHKHSDLVLRGVCVAVEAQQILTLLAVDDVRRECLGDGRVKALAGSLAQGDEGVVNRREGHRLARDDVKPFIKVSGVDWGVGNAQRAPMSRGAAPARHEVHEADHGSAATALRRHRAGGEVLVAAAATSGVHAAADSGIAATSGVHAAAKAKGRLKIAASRHGAR